MKRKGEPLFRIAALIGSIVGIRCDGTSGEVFTKVPLEAPLGTLPAGCHDARRRGNVCVNETAWKAQAEQSCAESLELLKAHVLLDACGPGFYRGIYIRCCLVKEGP